MRLMMVKSLGLDAKTGDDDDDYDIDKETRSLQESLEEEERKKYKFHSLLDSTFNTPVSGNFIVYDFRSIRILQYLYVNCSLYILQSKSRTS